MGDAKDPPTREAYLAWLDQEIARHEQSRLELRANQHFERAAEQECYRTAYQQARVQFVRITDAASAERGEG